MVYYIQATIEFDNTEYMLWREIFQAARKENLLKPEIETAKRPVRPASVVLQYHVNPNSITIQTFVQSISKLTSFLPLSRILFS